MLHSELVAALKKPGAEILNQTTPQKADAQHMAIGIAGEVIELFDAILKGDKENVIEELGDIEFFLEGLRQNLGIGRLEPKTLSAPEVSVAAARTVVAGGNVLDLVKRWTIYNKPIDVDLLVITILDLESSMDAVRGWFGLSRDETIEHNTAKLSKRYATLSYSDKQAQDRADKA